MALLVLDGLALDQWVVLREVLAHQRPRLRFHDEAVFAWIPTTTAVSRQSIFAGKPPLYYPTSIWTTEREAALRDFVVVLTSDHGNLEAEGCGRPQEGAVADLRGERVRVYPDATLRARVKEHFPDAILWPPFGLPEEYLPLLAPGRFAFVQEGERLVGHGGISLEEVIVPFVRIERAHA